MRAWTFMATFLVAALTSCSIHADDFEGRRFYCGSMSSGQICLRTIGAQCELGLHRTSSLPPEETVVLVVGGVAKTVRGPSDLVGCVSITSEADAIEYLRFFSSLWTVRWFDHKQIELFPGRCVYACIPARRWRSLRLPTMTVTRVGDAFLVRRLVARHGIERWPLRVLEVVERISASGAIEEVSVKEVDVPSDTRSRLNFPFYY